MRRKDLLVFLGLEVFAIAWAGVVFSLLPSKLFAGALAGGYFICSGMFMLARANHWESKWRSLTWYMLFVHVFVISIPMVITRFAQMAVSFTDISIIGFSGPVFHKISTGVFGALIIATAIDWLRAKIKIPGVIEAGDQKSNSTN